MAIINDQKSKDNIGERCYPDSTSKRVVEDHFFRYKFARKFVKDKVVLDIACGEGYGAKILREEGMAKFVFAADNDRMTIEEAKRKYPGINFVVSDAANTSFLNNYFDVIISFETWHHVENYQDFIPEMSRILKPGGLLILSVPNEKVIYLNPFHKKFLTKFYKINFNEAKIKKYLKDFFIIEDWYGQRLVKRIYTNFLMKILLFIISKLNNSIKLKIECAFKLANGPEVVPMLKNSARYFVILCRKKK